MGSLAAGRSRKATDQSGDLRMENPEGVKKGGQGPGKSERRTDGSEDYVEGDGTQERADGTGKERKFQEDGKGDKIERKTAPRCDKRRIGVVQACVDQRRDPRRRIEEGEEQEQDRKLRRREQWKSIRRLMKIGDERRNWEELAERLEVRAEESGEMSEKMEDGVAKIGRQPC